jgi:malate dehydrogenase (oxaloacetate-decarboxylating)
VDAARTTRRYEVRSDPATGEKHVAVGVRGLALLQDPFLNKGTCFSREERQVFDLEGLLPPAVSTPEEQQQRALENYRKVGDDIQRYLFLAALQDRNETLFHRLLLDNFDELAPIVYTPTVGKACEEFSHIYRRPRGVYVSAEHRGNLARVLRSYGRDSAVRIIVATDNAGILGLGDLGVGGMGIPVGKLALYAAGAGIHPTACLPLDLDVGTDNETLLRDPLYLGLRRPRLRGAEYFSLLDELVEAIGQAFPEAVLQWEDFSNENAFRILERYRDVVPSFNDDIQGTGAVVVASIRSALRRIGRGLEGERIVFLGAGASGGGCALAVRATLREAGVPETELTRRVLLLDSKGLIVGDRPGLDGHKKLLAADRSMLASWDGGPKGTYGLLDVARNFHPTVLVGCSGQSGAFTEEIVRTMHASCPRPVILVLSNPTRMAEATPVDLLRWTEGAAVVATGSPFPPVDFRGETRSIGQANNALIFPGVGLGAIAVGARKLPDEAFLAASRALSDVACHAAAAPSDPILPPIRELRSVSGVVARAVALTIVEQGCAPDVAPGTLDARLAAVTWDPVYLPYRPA